MSGAAAAGGGSSAGEKLRSGEEQAREQDYQHQRDDDLGAGGDEAASVDSQRLAAISLHIQVRTDTFFPWWFEAAWCCYVHVVCTLFSRSFALCWVI